MSDDQKVVHIRIPRPNHDAPQEEIEIYNFLVEEGEKLFDPPYYAKPPTGKKALKNRAFLLMVAGIEKLKETYPIKDKNESKAVKQQIAKKSEHEAVF